MREVSAQLKAIAVFAENLKCQTMIGAHVEKYLTLLVIIHRPDQAQ